MEKNKHLDMACSVSTAQTCLTTITLNTQLSLTALSLSLSQTVSHVLASPLQKNQCHPKQVHGEKELE